jgi:hypothetical protein
MVALVLLEEMVAQEVCFGFFFCLGFLDFLVPLFHSHVIA